MQSRVLVGALVVDLATTTRLNVVSLQAHPEGIPVGAEARTEGRMVMVKGKKARFAITFSRGAAVGGGAVFVSTSVQGAVETAPRPAVVTPAVKLPTARTQGLLPALNVPFWSKNLPKVYSNDKSRSVLQQLLSGVRIGRPPADTRIISRNWPSALEHREQVTKIIEDDLGAGRLHGPFEAPPFDKCIVSPLGAFKKRGSNKIRLIHDLSYPSKGSVNSLINREDFSLSYSSVDDAAAICKSLGPGPVFMAKMDLENAFKHVMVHPQDWHLMGFTWPDSSGSDRYYFSKVLDFGLRSAPYLFDIFAAALLDFMYARGLPEKHVVRYVDDFIVMASSAAECQGHLDIMLNTCLASGFSVQPSKVTIPSETTEFLGIVIDTTQRQLRISDERLHELSTEVAAWLGTKRATKRKLLSLIGKLAFAAKVVRTGKAFLGRLLGAAKHVQALHHHVRLTEEARADLEWWHTCIETHNGIAYYDISWKGDDVIDIYTDASNVAFGAVCGPEWLQIAYVGTYAPLLSQSINWREFHAALVALATWASSLKGRAVIFHIDNMVVCNILNKLYTPVKDLMYFTRQWCLLIEKYNIAVTVVYIDTNSNVDADDLSRLNTQSFLERNPGADRHMTWPNLGVLNREDC